MNDSHYLGCEILLCISFPNQQWEDSEVWGIRLCEKYDCPAKYPSAFVSHKRLLLSRVM